MASMLSSLNLSQRPSRSVVAGSDDSDSTFFDDASHSGQDISPPQSTREIKSLIESNLISTDLQNVKVRAEWSLLDYARLEMKQGQSLSSMITVTGNPGIAWATQCEDYIDRFWPETGRVVLQAIQIYVEQSGKSMASDGDFGIKINPHHLGAHIEIQGTRNQIVQATQQLAWTAASFRPSTFAGKPTRLYKSLCVCETSKLANCHFKLKLKPLDVEEGGFCWVPRLHGIIASGFQTPMRGQEIGLEVSFDVLLAIACAQYPVYTENVMAFKGWKSLLFPTSASLDFSSIQWHIITGNGPRDRLVDHKLSKLTAPPNWRTSDLDEIKKARSFLGYSKHVDVLLGTESYPMQQSHKRSGAKVQKGRWFWQKEVTLNMGTSGMGIFGGGIGGKLCFSNTATANLEAFDGFEEALASSESAPVIMYDVEKCIAYLVPELSVALHVTLSWFEGRKDLEKGELTRLPRAEVSWHGGGATSACIPEKDLELKRSDGDRTWSFLGRLERSLRLLNLTRDTEKAQPPTFRSRNYLYGWDIADVVASRDQTSRREFEIREGLHRKWIKHIGQNPLVPVLFGNNITPPILPHNTSEICRHWDPIPMGENYLLGSWQCFADLAGYCDGVVGEQRLTAACYVRRMDNHRPFRPCRYGETSCRRLHQVTTQSDPSSRMKMYKKGALLIGSADAAIDEVNLCEPKSLELSDEAESDPEVYSEEFEKRRNQEERGFFNVAAHIMHTDKVSCLPTPSIIEPKPRLSGDTLRPLKLKISSASLSSLSTKENPKSSSDNNTSKGNSSGSKSSSSKPKSPTSVAPSASHTVDRDFDHDCRLLIMAFARRRDLDPETVDATSLIQDGQRLYDQWVRQRNLLSNAYKQVCASLVADAEVEMDAEERENLIEKT